MKKLLYLSFLVVLSSLLFSCKIQYSANLYATYKIFVKGKKFGVINGDTKEIIIPATNSWINIVIYQSDDLPEKVQIFETYRKNTRNKLYDTRGKVLCTLKENENVKYGFVHNGEVYIVTNIYMSEIDQSVARLVRINENFEEGEELLFYNRISHLGFKNMFSFHEYYDIENEIEFYKSSFGLFDINTDKKVMFSYDDIYFGWIYNKDKNEVWLKTKTRKPSEHFDIIVDSTLTINTILK